MTLNLDNLFIPADFDQIEIERRKAKELKRSAWWKNRLGEGICHYCRRRCSPAELTMDHVIPLIRGGRSTRGNCVTACRECNQTKGGTSAEGWKRNLESET